MSPGDVILVNFPFDDREEYKKRPALVVAEVADGRVPDLIVMQVTGSEARINNPMRGDIVTSDPVFHKMSVVRCRKVFTLRESSVVCVLGSVTTTLLDQARTEIKALLSA